MFKHTSLFIKICAYVFLVVNCYKQFIDIAINTSYLNTGQLMGVESMLNMVWNCFISFLIAAIIYGFGIIVQYYEKGKTSDLTKS